MITKKIRQVTGTSKGVTFTKEDLEVLDADLEDFVIVDKIKKRKKKNE